MDPRKKKAIGFLITGGLFFLVGLVTLAVPTTPSWLPVLLEIVASVTLILGISVQLPEP